MTYYGIDLRLPRQGSPRVSPGALRFVLGVVVGLVAACACCRALRHAPPASDAQLRPCEEPGSGPAAQHRRRLGAERRGVADAALERMVEALRPVRAQDLAAEPQPVAVDLGEPGDRRLAGAVEARRETPARPRAGGRSARRGSPRAAPPPASSPPALLDADGALRDRRQHLLGLDRRCGTSRRARAAAARPSPRKVAAATPSSSLRSRVSTLPRNSTTPRSGRRCSTWARRRRLEVPTTRPAAGPRARPRPARRRRRATSSRGRQQVMARPVGLQRRHVLHRVHGDVDRAGGQRLLDLAGEEPLAAELAPAAGPAPGRRWCGSARSRRPPPAARAPPSAGRAPRAPAPAPAGCRGCRCAAAGPEGRSRASARFPFRGRSVRSRRAAARRGGGDGGRDGR